MEPNIITIGIDSSTKNCGVAVFVNGDLENTYNYEFKGTYNLDKLFEIINTFRDLFEMLQPILVIIEEPVPVRNGRAVTSLNQVAGAIIAEAWGEGTTVDFINNKVAKRLMGYETKQESINLAVKLGADPEITEHEADAIMMVETYKKIISGVKL